mgnify:CR=1 FL=1
MFAPTQEEVRRFFCSAWAKSRAGQPMEAIETLAAGWIAEHPEWHADFADAEAAVARGYTCLLYTSDAADERSRGGLGGRRNIKKKNQ